MAKLIEVNKHTDIRGHLVVLQDQIPFDVKRVFYIFGVPTSVQRGGHRHINTRQVLICVAGSCLIDIDNGAGLQTVHLDSPNKCLILEPEDYHIMREFAEGTILLVLANSKYDANDYIFEGYEYHDPIRKSG